MVRIKKNILITGLPGVGKTTLIQKLAGELNDFHPAGFYTAEIRNRGTRKGFELVSLDGRRGVLSHVDMASRHRVGKYRVDVKGFDDFLDKLPFFEPSTRLIIIDEIGKMECLSEKFKKLVKGLLDSERLVVATVALKGEGFIAEVKAREDVKLYEITQANRDSLLAEILKALKVL